MKNFKFILGAIVLALTTLFVACQKDVTAPSVLASTNTQENVSSALPTDSRNMTDAEVQNYGQMADEFARCLSVSAGMNQDLRDFMKRQVLATFDGDYNFLVNPALSYRFADGTTFESKILRVARTPESALAIKEFILANPRLQVAIPVNVERWNTSSAISTLSLGADYDDQRTPTVSGYDARGNRISVSATEEPTTPYLVVSQNERIDNSGRLLTGLAGETRTGSTLDTRNCYGLDNKWEFMNSAKVSNMSAIEGWLLGGPELRFGIKQTNGTAINSPGPMASTCRSCINNSWKTFNLNLFNWSQATYGSAVIVSVEEYDGGVITTIPITVVVSGVTISTSIPIWNNDEYVGTSPAYFTDCNLMEYNVGSVQYKLNRP